MTYVIAEPSVDVNGKARIEECPVECIYERMPLQVNESAMLRPVTKRARRRHDWLLVETVGNEPAVVAQARQLKNLVPITAFRRRRPHLAAIETAIAESIRTGESLSRPLPARGVGRRPTRGMRRRRCCKAARRPPPARPRWPSRGHRWGSAAGEPALAAMTSAGRWFERVVFVTTMKSPSGHF